MEAHRDFVLGDGDIGRHVDQVAEDLARLCIVIAAHAASHQAIETAAQDQQRHVKIDFEADRGGQGVAVKKAHGIGEGIFDEHAFGIAGDQLAGSGAGVVGQQDGGLLMAQILDEDLAEDALAGLDLLLKDARRAVFALGQVEGDLAPCRGGKLGDLGEQAGGTPPQGNEGDLRLVEAIEPVIGGQLGVEDEVLWRAAVLAGPEVNKAEDLLGFLAPCLRRGKLLRMSAFE
jgi:hypothetical protein